MKLRYMLRRWQAAAVLLGIIPSAQAADRVVTVQRSADLMKGVSAMPSIAGAVDEAERRINAALPRLDANARKAAVQCKADGGKDSWWERTVYATMSGPRYLSYEIIDNTFCGGAHPNVSTMSIVYDLTTGAPVDWTALLPATLTGKLALTSGADGTKMVTLSGQTLYALYLTGYRPRSGDAKKDGEDDECREAVADAGDGGSAPGMMAWLDAKKDGLVVQFDLPHVAESCADSVVIPTAVLRTVGVQPILVEALTKAHKGSFGVR